MSMREAIELMKILGPHAAQFTKNRKVTKVMKALFNGVWSDAPSQALRMLALMYHKPVEEIAVEYQDKRGVDLLNAVMEGFVVNNLVELIDAAHYLHLSPARFEHGR